MLLGWWVRVRLRSSLLLVVLLSLIILLLLGRILLLLLMLLHLLLLGIAWRKFTTNRFTIIAVLPLIIDFMSHLRNRFKIHRKS